MNVTWTLRADYGGSWTILDETGKDIGGAMSQQDARCKANQLVQQRALKTGEPVYVDFRVEDNR